MHFEIVMIKLLELLPHWGIFLLVMCFGIQVGMTSDNQDLNGVLELNESLGIVDPESQTSRYSI